MSFPVCTSHDGVRNKFLIAECRELALVWADADSVFFTLSLLEENRHSRASLRLSELLLWDELRSGRCPFEGVMSRLLQGVAGTPDFF